MTTTCNNLEIVKKLANIRMEIAQLLGYNRLMPNITSRSEWQKTVSLYINCWTNCWKLTLLPPQQEYAEVQALARQAEGDDFVSDALGLGLLFP